MSSILSNVCVCVVVLWLKVLWMLKQKCWNMHVMQYACYTLWNCKHYVAWHHIYKVSMCSIGLVENGQFSIQIWIVHLIIFINFWILNIQLTKMANNTDYHYIISHGGQNPIQSSIPLDFNFVTALCCRTSKMTFQQHCQGNNVSNPLRFLSLF